MNKVAWGLSCFVCFVIFSVIFSFKAYSQDSTNVTTPTEIRITSEVDRTQVPLNRTLKLTVRVEWTGDIDRYQISELEDPVINNLEIFSTSSADFRTSEGGVEKAARIYEFILKPKTLGMAYVDGALLSYVDLKTGEGHSLRTNRINVEVVESEPEPGEKRGFFFWLFAVVIPIILGGVVGYFVKKKLEKRGQEPPHVPVKSLEEEYLEQIYETVSLEKVKSNLSQGYYLLSKIARRYLKQKYDLDALELTTDEILETLSKREDVDENIRKMIEEILRTCDVAKFAGSEGDLNEYQRIYTLFESILEKNQIQENNNRPQDAEK